MSHPDTSPSIMHGLSTTVTLTPDRAILTPPDIFGWDKLKEKLKKEAKFREITSQVPNLKVPNVLSISESAHKIETERAVGINLTVQEGQAQGKCVDFFQIPTEMKIKGVLTYLRAISSINQENFSFVDHKSDSVFIDPDSGAITIVDIDGMSQEPSPADSFKREWTGGLDEVIKSFFTRMLSRPDEVQYAIPAGIQLMLKKGNEYKSAGEMVRDLESYLEGNDPFSQSSIDGLMQMKEHISLLAKVFNDNEIQQEIEKTDFSKMTPIQTDLMESTIYTRQVIRSGEPKAIDHYSLHYT